MIPEEAWSLRTNQWHHIAISGDRVYLDGRLSTWWRRLWWWFALAFWIIVGKEKPLEVKLRKVAELGSISDMEGERWKLRKPWAG